MEEEGGGGREGGETERGSEESLGKQRLVNCRSGRGDWWRASGSRWKLQDKTMYPLARLRLAEVSDKAAAGTPKRRLSEPLPLIPKRFKATYRQGRDFNVCKAASWKSGRLSF